MVLFASRILSVEYQSRMSRPIFEYDQRLLRARFERSPFRRCVLSDFSEASRMAQDLRRDSQPSLANLEIGPARGEAQESGK